MHILLPCMERKYIAFISRAIHIQTERKMETNYIKMNLHYLTEKNQFHFFFFIFSKMFLSVLKPKTFSSKSAIRADFFPLIT